MKISLIVFCICCFLPCALPAAAPHSTPHTHTTQVKNTKRKPNRVKRNKVHKTHAH